VSNSPIIRPISWLATLPQFVALALAVLVGIYFSPADWVLGMVLGTAAYLLYSFGSRLLLARHHSAGISLSQQGRYPDAISRYQRSLEFFDRYPWIDRYRSLVMMAPSALSYREMALINMGACSNQIGDYEQARAYYAECLTRYPGNTLATAVLHQMDAAAGQNPSR